MAQQVKDPMLLLRSLLWHGLIPGLGTSTCCERGQKKKKRRKIYLYVYLYVYLYLYLYISRFLAGISGQLLYKSRHSHTWSYSLKQLIYCEYSIICAVSILLGNEVLSLANNIRCFSFL